MSGETTDIYFRRAQQVLEAEGLNPICTVEFFPSKPGLLSGIDEALQLIEEVVPPENREVEAIEEGSEIERKEVVMRVRAPLQTLRPVRNAAVGDFVALHRMGYCGPGVCRGGWGHSCGELRG